MKPFLSIPVPFRSLASDWFRNRPRNWVRTLAILCILALSAAVPARASSPSTVPQPIALWDFNQTNDLLRATSGAATLSVVGGLRVSAASGTGSSDPATNSDHALQLTGFPKQGTAARSAGLEITASTVGFGSVALVFDIRATSTASRRIQVLYSTDGQNQRSGPSFTLGAGTAFTNGLTVDLSGLPDTSGQPELRVRLVSDWEGDGYVGAGGNYSTVGTWRIDHLRLMGVPTGVDAPDPRPEGPSSLIITAQPRSLEVPEGGGALFRVAARGDGPLGYQWCLDGQPLPGATRQELRIAQVYRDQLGLYTVRITQGSDSVLSDEAALTLTTDPAAIPTRVDAIPGPDGSIRLSWPVRPGKTYSVLRSVGWEGPTVVIASGLLGGSFTETPPIGLTHFYWVQIQ